MIAEESFLLGEFGEHYREWAAATPAFIPAMSLWHAPRRPFSMKKVLANESPTLAQIVVVVTLIQLARDWVLWRQVEPSGLVLAGLSGLSLVAYVVLRAIRKNTRWLSTTSDAGTAEPRARPVARPEAVFRED
jgi:protein-S-isoprenylcysteine O-methyltransferase Ste14